MAEIMGGGLNEFPYLRFSNERIFANMFERRLENPNLDPRLKDPANWPPGLRAEYGDDKGVTGANVHREKVSQAFRQLRKEIDEFNPDIILIWSKEQMENFGEEVMPPFCVYAYDEMQFRPHARYKEQDTGGTVWGESLDTEITLQGNRTAAKYLTSKLIGENFDMSYAYKPLHMRPLAHTFEGLLTHLDWERKGIPYSVVPFYINAYGHLHLTNKGFSKDGELDPPAPSVQRCFELGKATARILRDSPWRVALIAGSSWSHAHVNPKNDFLYPDIEGDRELFNALERADYKFWGDMTLESMIQSGRQEILSWVALAGAMEELQLKPKFLDFTETWVFNSTKVTAAFK